MVVIPGVKLAEPRQCSMKLHVSNLLRSSSSLHSWKCNGEKADEQVCYVDIEEDHITFRTEASSVVFHLQHLQLFPASCRGLRWCSPSELHLSLQAKVSQGKSFNVECKNGIIQHAEEEISANNQDIVVNKIQECQHSCYCAGCGRPIFSSKSAFKRVLPLPSENWSDFADIWFCHNHSHSQPQDVDTTTSTFSSSLPQELEKTELQHPKTLSPRPGDCLVSSLYLLVHSAQVCQTTVGITPHTQRIVCRRCGNFIGFVKDKGKSSCSKSQTEDSDVYKIYLHAVKFLNLDTFDSCNLGDGGLPLSKVPEDQNDSLSQGLVEDFLCQMFRDQSRQFTSFRFIIQSSHEEHADNVPIVLLVWLLDQNLDVFSSDCRLPAGSSHSHSNQVSPTQVLKFLYKASFVSTRENRQCGKEGTIFKMWERDNTVHGLDLPYPLCKQLLSLLIASTKQLPFSQRSLNSFHVGYLCKRELSQVN
ncbi:E3 ubiquitin-protein ligase E3D-like [Babylonia areolata]|uniref:E3 ubiquitin-protein ligase E3D-like n=1 Tax=Babylonia areolata TaxID=304850 RepID=UPI003FD227B2